mgnify:CR=1 FL=1
MNPKVKNILEWCYCIVIAIVLALLVRCFIGTPTIVKQRSMYPTLKPDQRLILNRLAITFHSDLKKGEIITFEAPSEAHIDIDKADMSNPVAKYDGGPKSILGKFAYYVLEVTKTTYIKRVIGLPGDHVEIKNNKVYINGEKLKEDYLDSSVVTTPCDGAFTDLIVPEGYIYVLGDNRPQSTDSRSFGCIPIDKVEGKVAFRFWPLNTFGNPDKK